MSYLLVLLITVTILSTVTVSLNMVVGYTGQPNLGQSAVFGIGAYFAAVFATSYSMPFWFCFLAAGLIAGVAGALIGAISLRLHQDFFAITTLGLNFIVVATFQTLPFFGGATGLYGIPLPTIAGYELDYPGLAICSLLLLLCTVGVSLLVNRSWFGGVLQAVREDENLAASLGAPVELARCEWIERRENVIALGPSGTGKTHVALGLGLAACQKGLSVGFITAAALVSEMMEARDERRLLRFQKLMAGYKLLIIDELGFVPLSKTGAELLFELISQRYERGSTLITSNLPFDEWTETFGSERLTGALLDRITHHVNILEMNGESYRLAHSRARKAG